MSLGFSVHSEGLEESGSILGQCVKTPHLPRRPATPPLYKARQSKVGAF